MKNTMKKPVAIPVEKLRPFAGHPFKVRDDDEMNTLIESIQTQGVLSPLIVRPIENTDEYEVISGHRRLHTAQKAGITEVPALIYALDRDAAAIAVVDSNLHREHISPSEKAFAYKLKADALKHQGQRTDITSEQIGRVDKVIFILIWANKKDALWRHPACFIIRFRFNAVADKRQWSSAASKPRRKTRAKLCSRFCAENEPSHQTCRSFSASR